MFMLPTNYCRRIEDADGTTRGDTRGSRNPATYRSDVRTNLLFGKVCLLRSNAIRGALHAFSNQRCKRTDIGVDAGALKSGEVSMPTFALAPLEGSGNQRSTQDAGCTCDHFFGDWRVCWLGVRLSYSVMVVPEILK